MFNGFLASWFGGSGRASARRGPPSRPPNSSPFAPSQASSTLGTHAERKELLRTAMRETLQCNGIPEAWLSADLLRTTSTRREQAIHVRLLVRHWEPPLVLHGIALEHDFLRRLMALDPTATDWLTGFSWQFAMADLSGCPELPAPSSWTRTAPLARAVPLPPAQPEPADAPPTTTAGDIIAGPVVIPQSSDDVRADLERLLALRDDDLRRHGAGEDGFAPTRPVSI